MQPDSMNYQDWIEKAVNELRAAVAILEYYEEPPTDTICYHCHQVVEKSLKAFLIRNSGELPHIHDLVGLLNRCLKIDSSLSKLKKTVFVLNQYFIEAKYPLDEPIVYSRDEAETAKKVAEEILMAS